MNTTPNETPVDPQAGLLQAQLETAKARIFHSTNDQQDGFLLLSSPHEAMPKLGFLDPVLNPVEKIVWANIWIYAKEQGGNLAGFPSHQTLMVRCNLPHSQPISRAIKVLRLCRWITLCERVHEPETGRIKGNLYLLHDEPAPLSLTKEFDDTYLEFLHQCAQHRDARLCDIAGRVLEVIEDELADGVDPLVHNPLRQYDLRLRSSRDLEALESQQGLSRRLATLQPQRKPEAPIFFSTKVLPRREAASSPAAKKHQVRNPHMVFSDETGQRTPGTKFTPGVFQQKDQKIPSAKSTPGVNERSSSSSYINKTTTTYTQENENRTARAESLIKPAELSRNEYHLILKRIAKYSLEDQQNLLDEIGEQIKLRKDTANPVRNPVGYLNWICQQIDKGEQPLSSAHLNRQLRRKREAEREAAERQAAQRAMSKLEELKRKSAAARARERGNG